MALKSRDDIPVILRGLKALDCDERSCERLFSLLERRQGETRGCDLSRGHRGMKLWSMGVLPLLKDGPAMDAILACWSCVKNSLQIPLTVGA